MKSQPEWGARLSHPYPARRACPTAHLHALDEHGGELLWPLRVRSRLLREAQELPGDQPGVDAGGDGAAPGLCLLASGGCGPPALWVCSGDLPLLWLLPSRLAGCPSPRPLPQPFPPLPPSLLHPSTHPPISPPSLPVSPSFPPSPPCVYCVSTHTTHRFIRLPLSSSHPSATPAHLRPLLSSPTNHPPTVNIPHLAACPSPCPPSTRLSTAPTHMLPIHLPSCLSDQPPCLLHSPPSSWPSAIEAPVGVSLSIRSSITAALSPHLEPPHSVGMMSSLLLHPVHPQLRLLLTSSLCGPASLTSWFLEQDVLPLASGLRTCCPFCPEHFLFPPPLTSVPSPHFPVVL